MASFRKPLRLASLEHVRHQSVEFECLDLAQNPARGGWGRWLQRRLARVHECERVPLAVGHKPGCEFIYAFLVEETFYALGNLNKRPVSAKATEPVFGVAVVGFTAMHEGVQETAVGVVDVLRNCV